MLYSTSIENCKIANISSSKKVFTATLSPITKCIITESLSSVVNGCVYRMTAGK